MEPATGASTWALGSHKCIIKIGILTKKAMIKIKKRKLFEEVRPMKTLNSTEPITLWSQKIPSNKGKEAANV